MEKEITVIIVLYEEKLDLIFQCLENIKNYKIIIVDNAGNIYLKKQIEEKFKIYSFKIRFLMNWMNAILFFNKYNKIG